MKHFKIEPTDLDGPNGKLTYKDLTISCLNHMDPRQGLTYDEMKARQRVEDAIADVEVGKSAKLEDQDATKLKSIVKDMQWLGRHKDIMAFCEAVESIK